MERTLPRSVKQTFASIFIRRSKAGHIKTKELIHRKGKVHVVPDALSRTIVEVAAIQITKPDNWYIKMKNNVSE